MNKLSVVAFAMAFLVLSITVFTATDNPKNFLDLHGMLIVIGGSVAATSISFKLDSLMGMLKVIWYRMFLGKKISYVIIIKDMMIIAEAYRNDSPDLREIIKRSDDFFLKEAMGMLLEEMTDDIRVVRMMRNRCETIFGRYASDANKFKAMGKFPPAMGLLGAVVGMIALLGKIGQPGAEKMVGPAMSVALVATMYGIALANFFVIPLGENLAEAAKEIRLKNMIIVEGVRLISQRTNPILMAEELNSFLLPAERIDWKKMYER